jgi:anti-anti-sigma factor
MSVEIRIENQASGAAVVHIAGRLDLLAAGEAKQQLVDAVGVGHKKLVVDLSDVSFVDSSGLGALISGLKAARLAGGDLRIARAGEQARVILGLTTLDRVMRPYETLEEALTDF